MNKRKMLCPTAVSSTQMEDHQGKRLPLVSDIIIAALFFRSCSTFTRKKAARLMTMNVLN